MQTRVVGKGGRSAVIRLRKDPFHSLGPTRLSLRVVVFFCGFVGGIGNALFKTLDGLPEPFAELRQAARAENNQHNYQYDDQLRHSKSKHVASLYSSIVLRFLN